MVFNQQSGEYFSFDEYHRYKNKLDESYMFEDEEREYESFFRANMPEGDEQDAILNNCYILKKYLLNFINDQHCSNGKCCSYMNYWLNKKMRKNGKNLVKSDFGVYNNYIAYYNSRNNAKVCESNELFIRNDIYEEMKRLYTLYELYNTFKTISDQNSSRCIQLKSCVTHYHSILPNCKKNRGTKFCKALQNFKNIFSTDDFVSISECERNFGEMKLKDLQDLLELDQQQVDLDILQSNREKSRKESLRSSLHSQVESTEGDSYSTLSSFSHSTVIQTLFSSALGMSILFFLSYKFTPFGKWMRSALLRKNIITHYETEEDTQDILSHTYENTNIDTDDSIHNIQYYATQNS
ncbi:PIR Superfamily Protein [Plasmodium ovale wallikeri]|uniref:PIR Superfamily Protein n=1 Tax=Plasmodium ovale wallikeri TaxID=864142 RepID=A0A1A9ATA8_PLAOA|nr:PIR Superfamily Protein [Plasmodium ovale wallikeri]SBT59350.1 PIR Superfamily Protein [Plasmodium ovale wallikeri]